MLKKLKRRVRNIFVTGLLITIPVAFTYFVLNFLFNKLDGTLSPIFNDLLAKGLIRAGFTVAKDFHIPGIGLAMMILTIFFVGLFTTNIFGKKLIHLGEAIVEKIPVVRSIYTGTKQVVTSIAEADTAAFRKCVLVEFPRSGIYAMGFVTGEARGEVQMKTDRQVVNVFIPTTPNPTSGFLIFVAKEEIIELKMSIEDGIKLIISAGIVTPEYEPGKKAGIKAVRDIKDIKV